DDREPEPFGVLARRVVAERFDDGMADGDDLDRASGAQPERRVGAPGKAWACGAGLWFAEGGRQSSWPQAGGTAWLVPFRARPCPLRSATGLGMAAKGSTWRTRASLRWARPAISDGRPARSPASSRRA